MSHEWHIPPWEQAGLPASAGHPHWRVWQGAYLWAVNQRQRESR